MAQQKTKKPSNFIDKITKRALFYSTEMIHQANNREDVEKGDPKVGGHPAACASVTHILGALHLFVREPQDYIAVKPHGAPMDHAYSHLLRLFHHPDGEIFTEEQAKTVMFKLRHFMDPSDPNHEPAFQSYHAVWDPDHFHYLPSGSVGIPPVASVYLALAYRFAAHHGFDVPKDAHFWSIMGDSEFREGSLAECMPDAAERELGSVTWIVDYNRQNLDGTRIKNEEGIQGTDAERIERLGKANGWKVIQVRHGKKRLALFESVGKALQDAIESLSDFELQALLVKGDGKTVRDRLVEIAPSIKAKLAKVTDDEMEEFLEDLGGHDIEVLTETFKSCRKSKKPTLVVIHTVKGWGLEGLKAVTGNHSMLVSDEGMEKLRKEQGITASDPFAMFAEKTEERKFCEERGAYIRKGIEYHRELKEKNLQLVKEKFENQQGFATQFGINLKLSPWANTQWMWGQLAAKVVRIANHGTNDEDEKRWELGARHILTLAPDVGTSTNLNPNMDGKVYGPQITEDFESTYHVKDKRRPDLVPLEKEANRHLRFEIEEANAMSCLGSFGKMRDLIGVPLMPLMTVYDFFIKRALDQYFYNVYWKSSFVLVGTPSGVTLSPEGAQHSWKSDLQIPNGITWEPAFAVEMDWILADAFQRHFAFDNVDREGVLIRAVTRGIEQKQMMDRLKTQVRFQGVEEAQILETIRLELLQGGYWLVNYTGYQSYAPGDNVVNLFVMGALVPEALKASDLLLEQGIYANIAVVSSPDLLIGTLGRDTGYAHLKHGLGINGNLYLTPTREVPVGTLQVSQNNVGGQIELNSKADVLSLRGARVPIVAVFDGEPGILDNIGSIVGVPQETLAVRKHSKSGRPTDVYKYHHLDAESIAHAAVQMLEQTASETLVVNRAVLEEVAETEQPAVATEAEEDQTRH